MKMNNDLPLYSYLKEFSDRNEIRMHMPGHKGKNLNGLFSDAAKIDYTEIPETGNLYTEEGPIRLSENLFASYIGSEDCCYLTGGATLGIYSMIASVCRPDDKVLIDRGCHKSVYNASALFQIQTDYIYPHLMDPFGISDGFNMSELENKLKSGEYKAFILTSPTYYGICLPIKEIAEICHRNNTLLLVDGAHSAHFPAIGLSNACVNGADLEIISTHKTISALGQTAVAVGKKNLIQQLRYQASILGSSSPSYLLMSSIDLSRYEMEHTGKTEYIKTAKNVQNIKSEINQKTAFKALDENPVNCVIDPCRLTVCTSCAGLSGYDAAQSLRKDFHIHVEMADDNNIVLICTSKDTEKELSQVQNAIISLSAGRSSVTVQNQNFPLPESCVRASQAYYGKKRSIKLTDAVGCISGQLITPYPPGIPVIAYGEKISKKHIAYLSKKMYNMNERIYIIQE